MTSLSLAGMILIALLLFLVVAVVGGIVLAVVFASRSQREMSANPNLSPCPDCQKLISIHATTCPHCGRPLKSA